MTIALLCSLQLRLVDLKREGCASDFFVLVWQTNTHKAERPSCFLLRRSDAQQQLIAFRQALSHRPEFAHQLCQSLASNGDLFGLAPSLWPAHTLRPRARTASLALNREPCATADRATSSHAC